MLEVFYNVFLSEGESADTVTMATEALEKRWHALKTLLKDTRSKVDINVDTKKFYEELKSLESLLGTYEKWLVATETPGEDMADISKHLEQSKVILRTSP